MSCNLNKENEPSQNSNNFTHIGASESDLHRDSSYGFLQQVNHRRKTTDDGTGVRTVPLKHHSKNGSTSLPIGPVAKA